MKSPLNSLRRRSKSVTSASHKSDKSNKSNKGPLADAPEILPVRSKSRTRNLRRSLSQTRLRYSKSLSDGDEGTYLDYSVGEEDVKNEKKAADVQKPTEDLQNQKYNNVNNNNINNNNINNNHTTNTNTNTNNVNNSNNTSALHHNGALMGLDGNQGEITKPTRSSFSPSAASLSTSLANTPSQPAVVADKSTLSANRAAIVDGAAVNNANTDNSNVAGGGVANGNSTGNGNSKQDKGIFSGLLTMVANQIGTMSAPNDGKTSDNFSSKKPELQLKDRTNTTVLGNSSQTEPQKAPLSGRKGHLPLNSENLSINDIQFKAVKQDSPITTLGHGNLSLSDFVSVPGNAQYKKGMGVESPTSSTPVNERLPERATTVINHTGAPIMNRADSNAKRQNQGSANAPYSITEQQQLQQKLKALQQQQQQGIPLTQNNTNYNKTIKTPQNEQTALLPEMRVTRASKGQASGYQDGTMSPKSAMLSAPALPINQNKNLSVPIKHSSSMGGNAFDQDTESPRRSTLDDDTRRGRGLILSKRQNQGSTASNLNLSMPASRSNSRTASIKQIITRDGNELQADDIRRKGSLKGRAFDDLSFASERKQREFHATFKNLPVGENMYVDYVCALSKEILLQGKLYVSQNYISFNSNILGWVTNISIPLEEIVQVEKKLTAGFIPNALTIQTLHLKYFFTSFISRDSTFDFITMLWHHAVRGPNLASRGGSHLGSDDDESVGSSDDGYDSDSGFSDDDMDDISDMDNMTSGTEDDGSESESMLKEGNGGNDASNASGNANGAANGGRANREKSISKRDDKSKNKNSPNNNHNGGGSSSGGDGSGDGDNSLGGLPVLGPTKHAPTKSPWEKKPNETEIQTINFPAPPGTVFELLFGEKDVEFSKNLIQRQKNFDLSDIPPYTKNPKTGLKERKYTYTKPLSAPVGPKQTKCIITDVLEKVDVENEGLIQVLQITQTPDIPSGNSFLVSTRFYFTWAENNGTLLQVVTFIEWSGKSWIKGAIEGGTISGQKDSVEILVTAVNEEISSKMSSSGKGGGGKSRKRPKAKSKARKPKSPTSRKTNTPTTIQKAPEPTIFSKIFDLVKLIASALPIPLLSEEIKAYLIIALFGALFIVPMFMRVFGNKDPYSEINYITGYSGNRQGEYTVIPPLYKLQDNANLRNELQLYIWDWVEQKAQSDKASNGRKQQGADSSSSDDTIGSIWRDKYYRNSLSDTQKEYVNTILKNQRLHQLSKAYSKQELQEYIKLNELRLDELKKNVNNM